MLTGGAAAPCRRRPFQYLVLLRQEPGASTAHRQRGCRADVHWQSGEGSRRPHPGAAAVQTCAGKALAAELSHAAWPCTTATTTTTTTRRGGRTERGKLVLLLRPESQLEPRPIPRGLRRPPFPPGRHGCGPQAGQDMASETAKIWPPRRPRDGLQDGQDPR
eukprot:7281179-Pyramimonas_sp.AAC.1